MVTLTLIGELSPRGVAKVLCNGQLFCEMYMDRHHSTLLRDPGGMATGLWELYRSMSPEPEAYGDFPEETLQKARHDLKRIFSIVNDYQAPASGNGVTVTLGFSVDDQVDQPLLDHLGQAVEMAVQRMYHEGAITPTADDERTVTLESVSSVAS